MSGESHGRDSHRTLVITVACEREACAFIPETPLISDPLTLRANCLRIKVELPASLFALSVTHCILKERNSNDGLGKWVSLSTLINVPMMLTGLAYLTL